MYKLMHIMFNVKVFYNMITALDARKKKTVGGVIIKCHEHRLLLRIVICRSRNCKAYNFPKRI